MSAFDEVVGQERAVAALRAAIAAPVHAYLLTGPPGSGKRAAARAFAAALLCESGGCVDCRSCRLVAVEAHPDVTFIEREGAWIDVKQAARITELASLSPVEGRRKVLVPIDFHLVKDAAAKLLKTIEEPPESTIFVILAEELPAELVTIASRCVRIDFGPVPPGVVADALVREGVAPDVAAEVAAASGGRLDRARLLASDPDFAARRAEWARVPARLDGSGAAVAVVAEELVALVAGAAVGPLEARHKAEAEALAERISRSGERGSGRKELEDRHKREVRRLRTDELRFGLAVLGSVYRDALVAGASPRACVRAIDAIEAAGREFERNPNELLLLQALLLELSRCDVGLAVGV